MLFLVLCSELDLAEFRLHVGVFDLRAFDVRENLFRFFDPAFRDEPSGALG